MDRAEFQRYIDNALQEAERVRTYCAQDEIVLIMTADFYRELLASTQTETATTTDSFMAIVLRLSTSRLKARWSRLRFLG